MFFQGRVSWMSLDSPVSTSKYVNSFLNWCHDRGLEFNYKFNSLSGGRVTNWTKCSTFYPVYNYGWQCPHCTVYSGFLASLLWIYPRSSKKYQYIDTLQHSASPWWCSKKTRSGCQIASLLLKEGKAALVDAYGENDENFKRRDLLSVMLKANLSTDIPESQRTNDCDALARKSLYLPHNGWNWTYSRDQHIPHCWLRNHQV